MNTLLRTETAIAAHRARLSASDGDAVSGAETRPEGKRARKWAATGEGEVTTLKVTANVPPSVNMCYTNMAGKGGKRRVLTKEARLYKEGLRVLTIAEAYFQKFRYVPGRRLALTLNFYFADRRKDVSNHVKLLEDALSAALGFNDRAVDVLHVERKGIDPKRPRCEVVLTML